MLNKVASRTRLRMDDNNMYDNWSEIIAIMKTVINHGGSRAELKALFEPWDGEPLQGP